MNMTLRMHSRAFALACVLLLKMPVGFATEASTGTRILEAADHAELAAEVSADGIVRVALVDDRIARVIRTPGGFAVDHDASSGDIYLRPAPDSAAPQASMALFVGSENGFTYRLTLIPTARGPAQILIRGPEAERPSPPPTVLGDTRVAAITGLIRAVAGGVLPEGYSVEADDHDPGALAEIVALEVWRGPQFDAEVFALGADAPMDAPALAARLSRSVVAVWVSGPAAGIPANGRFVAGRVAVVVREAHGR